jgi:Ca2+-binding RTX toxin-like protein
VAVQACDDLAATIVGTEENDNLAGGAGNDVIVSLGGNDTIDGGGGNDMICGGDGNDSIAGGDGDDTVEAEAGDDVGSGGAGGDFVRGGDGKDMLDGGTGSDLVRGAAGDDQMSGGDGLDIVSFLTAETGVQVDLGAGTAVGDGTDTFSSFEAMIGSDYNDVVTGSDGNDYFFPDDGIDVIHGGDGTDTLLFLGPVDADLAAHRSTGLPGGDVQEGNVTFDSIESLDGGVGSTLAGDAGPNQLFFASTMLGRGGDDALFGNEKSQTMVGGAGGDILSPGPGTDRIDGGAGKDTISYSDAATGVKVNLRKGRGAGEGAGTDTINAVETIEGSPFRDVLTGDNRPNTLFGKEGKDILSGGSGDDFLSGGSGFDLAAGGKGADYCVGSEHRSSCEFSDPATGATDEVFLPPQRVLHAATVPQKGAEAGQLAMLARISRAGSESGVAADSRSWPLGPFAGIVSTPENAVTPADDAPACSSAGGRFMTTIKPPKVVRPLSGTTGEEIVEWRGTLLQLRPHGGTKRITQTPLARSEIAGPGIHDHPEGTPWKTGNDPYTPYAWRVRRAGRYKWVISLRWTAAKEAYPPKLATSLSHYVQPGDRPRPFCAFGS